MSKTIIAREYAASATVTPITTPPGFVFDQHTVWPEPKNDLTVAFDHLVHGEEVAAAVHAGI
jgi:hypothetical protein